MRGKFRGLPLRPTLVSVVVALILAGAGGVGALAYGSSKRVVDDLWTRLSDTAGDVVTERALRYFEPAPPHMAFTLRRAADGYVDPADARETLDFFRAGLEANPEFTWVAHGSADGTYLAVHREGQRGEGIVGSWRTPIPGGGTRVRALRPDADGALAVVEETIDDYDPRGRPWYREAVAAGRCGWSTPYLFATGRVPGVTYFCPDVRGDELRGVWAIEYELRYVSEFLSHITVGRHGRVYLVTRDGIVVGHPRGLTSQEGPEGPTVAHAEGHPDPVLASAYRAYLETGEGPIELPGYMGIALPFPERSGIPWLALVVVPREEVVAPLRGQARNAVIIGTLAALLAAAMGVLFANRISRGLRTVAATMDRVGRFELADGSIALPPTFVREIIAMGEATNRMNTSLRSFAKYVPQDLVRDLMVTGEEAVLGGRAAELTVLFSDIAGFTTVAEQTDPDVLVQLLGEYFQAMSDAIQAEGGTVDKFIGDSIMAFWGAPRPREDHAEAACLAALRMRERLAALRAGWDARGLPHLDTRIGINTGAALVGNIGSPRRMNYTVMGDAVNLASRLEGLNKRYRTDVLVGDATARAVGETLVTRPLEWVAVKGKERPVLVHALIGRRTELDEKTLRGVAAHAEALELYRARRFDEALARLADVRTCLGDDDVPAGLLEASCRVYLEAPPPDGWDGRVTMDTK